MPNLWPLWPQASVIAWFALVLAVAAGHHGKPRTGDYNVFETLVFMGLVVWVLHAGGFW